MTAPSRSPCHTVRRHIVRNPARDPHLEPLEPPGFILLPTIEASSDGTATLRIPIPAFWVLTRGVQYVIIILCCLLSNEFGLWRKEESCEARSSDWQ